MKFRVLGVQVQDYISKKTSQPVKGLSLHCAYKDPQVDGEAVDSLFVSDRLDCCSALANVKPGVVLDVEFNRRGYLVDAVIVPSSPAGDRKK